SLVRRCARVGRHSGEERLCGPDVYSRRYVLLALPLHVYLASASVQGGLTVRGRSLSVKSLLQVIVNPSPCPKLPLSMPLLGDVRKWALQPSEVSATLCAPHGSPPGHDFENDCSAHLRHSAYPAARRAPAPAACGGRPHPGPARRRPLLEGVHLADR